MIKKFKELGKDSLIYGMGSSALQLVSFLLIPYYSKALSPEEYGQLAMIALLINGITPVAHFGIDSALFRFFMKTDDRLLQQSYVVWCLLFQLIVASALIFTLWQFFHPIDRYLFSSGLPYIAYLNFLVSLFFDNITTMLGVVTRAERKPKIFVTSQLLSSLLSLGLSIYLVLILERGVQGATFAGSMSRIFSCLLLLFLLRKYITIKLPPFAVLMEMLGYGFPYTWHRIQGIVVQFFVTFAINSWYGIASLGIFSMATKLNKPFNLIVTSVQKAWTPYKFKIHKEENMPEKTFSTMINNYWILVVFLWTTMSIILYFGMIFFVNERFHSGVNYIPFVCLLNIFFAFTWTVSTGFELKESQKKAPISSLISLVSLVTFALILKEFLDQRGFILAQSISYLFGGLYLFFEARKEIKIDFRFLSISIFLILNITLVSLFYLYPSIINGILFGLAAIIIYVLFLFHINGKQKVFNIIDMITRKISFVR